MKVGDAVSFSSANGVQHTGTVVKVWNDQTGRAWFSVKTPESRCPFPVIANETTEAK
jgi:hypothetical protein